MKKLSDDKRRSVIMIREVTGRLASFTRCSIEVTVDKALLPFADADTGRSDVEAIRRVPVIRSLKFQESASSDSLTSAKQNTLKLLLGFVRDATAAMSHFYASNSQVPHHLSLLPVAPDKRALVILEKNNKFSHL
ncbi:hypothetical protein AXG93_4142s1290 [Marchantia polymorpha subsp. ruderalis]|uniref:Uncharacterized protein n=1 Tax=Marchantia polymorpha subsp. ruderalis TaxID=1480154 RepID=A0A176WME7_MARPO|nr:hypothetical protein AXG93_4142s1290 [Marchantia polymorpha subsp. ruderalis]